MIDIKRCIEEFKPEGFTLSNNLGRKTFNTPCGSFAFTSNRPLDENFWKGPGSLFLQRVIEGINKQYYKEDFKYFVETSCNELNVIGTWGHPNLQLQFDDDYDQAKEQAINYILGEIK